MLHWRQQRFPPNNLSGSSWPTANARPNLTTGKRNTDWRIRPNSSANLLWPAPSQVFRRQRKKSKAAHRKGFHHQHARLTNRLRKALSVCFQATQTIWTEKHTPCTQKSNLRYDPEQANLLLVNVVKHCNNRRRWLYQDAWSQPTNSQMLLRRPIWSIKNSSTRLARFVRGFKPQLQRLSLRLFLRHRKSLLLRTRRHYYIAFVQGEYAHYLQSRLDDKVLGFKLWTTERASFNLVWSWRRNPWSRSSPCWRRNGEFRYRGLGNLQISQEPRHANLLSYPPFRHWTWWASQNRLSVIQPS